MSIPFAYFCEQRAVLRGTLKMASIGHLRGAELVAARGLLNEIGPAIFLVPEIPSVCGCRRSAVRATAVNITTRRCARYFQASSELTRLLALKNSPGGLRDRVAPPK